MGSFKEDTLMYVDHGLIHRCDDMRVPGANDNRGCTISSIDFTTIRNDLHACKSFQKITNIKKE